jgi:precorrin-2 dehydrogenase/sirohydrochlorin ferrochelatase
VPRNNRRFYPIFLDVEGRHAIVIGGGVVAERKTTGLLNAGAQVTLISPTLTRLLRRWATSGRIAAVLRSYKRGDLGRGKAQADLAFAVTDNPAVNHAVAAEAMRKRIWINMADGSTGFILPAVGRAGIMTLAVSSGGKNPALTQQIRDALIKPLTAAIARGLP